MALKKGAIFRLTPFFAFLLLAQIMDDCIINIDEIASVFKKIINHQL
jgi:DNA-directed RNA polymerase subunit E'/Rpb7